MHCLRVVAAELISSHGLMSWFTASDRTVVGGRQEDRLLARTGDVLTLNPVARDCRRFSVHPTHTRTLASDEPHPGLDNVGTRTGCFGAAAMCFVSLKTRPMLLGLLYLTTGGCQVVRLG